MNIVKPQIIFETIKTFLNVAMGNGSIEWDLNIPEVLQQKNTYNCGIFTILFSRSLHEVSTFKLFYYI